MAPLRKNRFTCPVCGKRAEFGKHFCVLGADDEEARSLLKAERRRSILAALGSAVAALVVVAFTTQIAGPGGLVLAAGTGGAALLALLVWQALAGWRRERSLLRACGMDRERAERLIEAEREAAPEAPRGIHVRRALELLERDRARQ